jgi:GT2 family glycosyltransferase
MAKISVIIPAYNSEQTILATITSGQNQTFVCVAKQVIHCKTPGSATTKAAVVEKAGLLTLQKVFTATPQLNYLKNQSLARFSSYCADLY